MCVCSGDAAAHTSSCSNTQTHKMHPIQCLDNQVLLSKVKSKSHTHTHTHKHARYCGSRSCVAIVTIVVHY